MSTTLPLTDQDHAALIESYPAQAAAISRLCSGLVTVTHEPTMLISDDDESPGQFVSISEDGGDDVYPPAFINGDFAPDLREHGGDAAGAVVHHLQWIADEQQKLADRVRARLAESDIEAAVAEARLEIANRPPEEPEKPREPTPEIDLPPSNEPTF